MLTDKKITILTIDDEDAVRESIIAFLEDCDYHAIGARTGKEGLSLFHRENPDLVLVDLRMPEMDGLEVLEAIRYVSPETPIIVASGMGVISDAVEALRLGAWDYLIKPIQDMNVLKYSIEKALERAKLISENRRYRKHLESEVESRSCELEQTNQRLTEFNNRLCGIIEAMHKFDFDDDINRCAANLLNKFGHELCCSGGSLYIRDHSGYKLVHALDPGHAAEHLPLDLPKDTFFGKLAHDLKPILIKSVSEFEPGKLHLCGGAQYTNSSIIMFPLLNRTGELMGLISLHNKDNPPFTKQDLEMGTLFATYCSEVLQAIKATNKLKNREQTFRTIASSAHDAIVLFDKDQQISFWNQQAQTLFGYSSEEACGQKIDSLLAPDDYQNIYNKTLPELLDPDRAHSFTGKTIELPAKTKTGERLNVEISISLYFLKDTWNAVAIFRNISDRKSFESALKRRSEAIEQACDWILITDLAGKIEFANSSWLSYQNMTRSPVSGSKITDFYKPREPVIFLNSAIAKAKINGQFADKMIFHGTNGQLHVISVCATLVKTETGKEDFIFWIMREISKQYSELVSNLQSEKMQAISRFAEGVSHELNNILTAIIGNAELIKRHIDPDSEDVISLEEILHAAQRATNLTDQLRSFNLDEKLDLKCCNLNQIIKNTIELLESSVDSKVEIRSHLEAVACDLKASPDHIKQIILNLGFNAIEAMPKGGRLTFETRNIDMPEGNYVELLVSDTGHGIECKDISRIFEPFFTTKPATKGTGVGLTTVYACVKKNNGKIWVHKTSPAGTVFRILIPTQSTLESFGREKVIANANESRCNRHTEQPICTETILIIDDEEIVRNVARSALISLGFKVKTAESASQGIEIYKQNRDKIDLVLLDLIMPDKTGDLVFEELKQINPSVKVIVASGFAHNDMITDLKNKGIAGFISKPFRIEQLRAEIAKDLQAHPAR